jgi:replicative DNA helicase
MSDIKPIYSIEAEQSVIQACVNNCERVHEFSFLDSSDFYHRAHREVFDLIIDLDGRGEFFDITVIGNYFGDEWGGFSYFIDMMKIRISDINAMAYARIVLDSSIRRKSIESYLSAIDDLSNQRLSSIEIIANSDDVINKQISRLSDGDNLSIDELIDHSLIAMEESNKSMERGLSTGIQEIDDQLGYRLQAYGEITAYGALSKNGKTLFANTIIARCGLKDSEASLVFSVEMPAVGMFNSIISAMTGVPSNFYDRQSYYQNKYPGSFSTWMGRWGEAAQRVRESGRIIIDDKKDVDVNYIVSQIRKRHALLKNKGVKLRFVLIDHFHRLNFDTSKKSMTYAMGDDAKKLKNVASELDISIALLVQLKEDCKDRAPTGYDILDTSRVRHEIQCFIGFKLYRQNGGTYFGISSDAHRYADTETHFGPKYVKLSNGIIKSLDEGEYFTPEKENNK